jgi:hypothetical protein
VAGGFRCRRRMASLIVNWLGDSKRFSSDQSIGIATGAPGRARTE